MMKKIITGLLMLVCFCANSQYLQSQDTVKTKPDTITKKIFILERSDTVSVRITYYADDGNLKHSFGRQIIRVQYQDDTKQVIKVLSVETEAETLTPNGKDAKGKPKFNVKFINIPKEFLFDVRKVIMPEDKK